MSDNFRDLERPDAARRKDVVLMAAVSGLEYLERPSRQDLAQFSRLFMPLFAAASAETKRTASAALSRLPRVPDDVAELIINQPIAIAAPFIAHYAGLRESALARAVARNGAPHARAAARRSDLSPQAIAALRGLNDPSVEGLLVLRGLIPAPAAPAAPLSPAASQPSSRSAIAPPPLDPSRDPSAGLREQLRALARGGPAPQAPLNRPVNASAAGRKLPVSRAAHRRVTEARLALLARHAQPNHETWFATALADAMEASYALSERIMMDISGRQLATALIGLGAPGETIKAALEAFFPHLSQPSAKHTLATDLIEQLDSESCAARLAAWLRADSYTTAGALHVPALADGQPVRSAPANRTEAGQQRQAGAPRKRA